MTDAPAPPPPLAPPPPPASAPVAGATARATSGVTSGGASGGASDGQTVRQTVETLVLALILALIARTFIAEPFVIPSGSMAPTLLGDHASATCPQCGFEIVADWPEDSRLWIGADHVPGALVRPETLECPMCRFPVPLAKGAEPARGDRVAVHKLPYALLTPNRWDVLVFKSPQVSPGPESNFIKRVIGLPGESIKLFEGDVFVRKPGESAYRRASKVDPQTNRRWRNVQQAVFVPVYDSRYYPLDADRQDQRPAASRFTFPWRPQTGDWRQAEGPRPRFDGQGVGELRFDRAELARRDGARRYPYNQLKSQSIFEPLEDLRVRAWVTPEGPGLAMTIRTTARLGGPAPETVALAIDAQGVLRLIAPDRPEDDATRLLAGPVQVGAPKPGRARHVELWAVDGEVLAWIDGREALRWSSAVTLEQALRGPRPEPKPRVAVQLQGAAATVERLALERDLYYGVHRSDQRALARGGVKSPEAFPQTEPDDTPGAALVSAEAGPAADLDQDHFFVAGDNGPISDDARFWTTVDPWVRVRYFPQTPEGEPDRFAGVVHRKLVVGRAFLVYYPNPFDLVPGWGGVLPDLGRMRLIH